MSDESRLSDSVASIPAPPAHSSANPARRSLARLLPGAGVVAALLLAASAGSQAFGPSVASAQPSDDSVQAGRTPPFNSAAERQAMISLLTQINERMARIETKLNTGLSVKVTEMPAISIKNMPPSSSTPAASVPAAVPVSGAPIAVPK